MANFNRTRPGSKPGPGKKRKSQTHKKGKHKTIRSRKPPAPPKAPDYEETGREAAYLKELVDKEAKVVVVLKSGEEMRGIVRYYDRDVFSLGPAEGGPKLFLRKSGVRYLYEE